MAHDEVLSPRFVGRPLAGSGEDGKPEGTSKYPKLTIYIKPLSKAKLEALSTLMDRPAWRIVEVALETYVQTIPSADRELIEEVARRIEERQAAAEQEAKLANAAGA